ncbi:thermonuclease family protein [Paracoccus rhizosphaerae]|uniref:Thermonuclease family protein n=1 Tax=Paracoccus rhizosphaerae TaxID=1133347 RepID=A0ABV6CHV5_9RHOB|nr:thermonuclease family protein [Paracoccus rhizosphaerae]
MAASAEVIDGDSLRLEGLAIRLHGIDAPEHDQVCSNHDRRNWPCGLAAGDYLSDLTRGREVICWKMDIDRYGRTVATCEVDGVDLGEAMVIEGLAWAYLRYSDAYAATEASAQRQGVGIWAADNLPAWDFRSSRHARSPERESCRIKGNISGSGTHIYHLPGTRDYDATRISEARGERWFCSEEDARAAGWRAPRH